MAKNGGSDRPILALYTIEIQALKNKMDFDEKMGYSSRVVVVVVVVVIVVGPELIDE